MYRNYLRIFNTLKSHYATKSNAIAVEMDAVVNENITNNIYKPRKHPGRISSKPVAVPANINEAIKECFTDYPIKAAKNEVEALCNYLWSRHPPKEQWEVDHKAEELRERMEPLLPDENADHDVKNRYQVIFKSNLKRETYCWKAMIYDKHTALNYLIARAAPEYAVLCRLFNEIKLRDPDFVPKSFFDFGSGVGTGTWALTECWEQRPKEYFTVDISPEMNEVARSVLFNAYEKKEINEDRFFQRQFLPATNTRYDLVVCAYSLFELPTAKTRLETVLNLWKKTRDYLVIVERGTNAGFGLICEARDFILSLDNDNYAGHVFSPCPNDLTCPRFHTDNTPCNFIVKYLPLRLGQKLDIQNELISYVIMRKGKRPESDPAWPRIVRHPLIRSKHTICRMCCADGKLKEVIFTAHRHGKVAYRCAKGSNWGDLLPVNIKDVPMENESIGNNENNSKDATEKLD